MDYKKVQAMMTKGIAIFSDEEGNFKVKRGGGIKIVGGKEVSTPIDDFTIYGACRDVNPNDVNGESIRSGDKRGFFNADVEVMVGDEVYIDGEAYRVINPRPVKPTQTVVAYRPVMRRVATIG